MFNYVKRTSTVVPLIRDFAKNEVREVWDLQRIDCAIKVSSWYLIEFVSIHHQGYKSKNLLTFWSYFGCVQLQWELHELKNNLKTLAIYKRLTPRNNWKFLDSWICMRARWSESCVTIGYPSGPILPARDFPRVSRKKKPSFRPCNGCGRTWGLNRVFFQLTN